MKCRVSLLTGVYLMAAGSLTHVRADWPMYRADAERSGCTNEPLPADLTVRWVYRPAAPPRPAWPSSRRMTFDLAPQPIVSGGLVIFGSSADDRMVAMDLGTGQLQWTFYTEGPVRFAPSAWRDRIFVVSDDGWLYALSTADGQLLWKRRGGPNDRKCFGNGRLISRWPARGGPVVRGDVVYFAAGIWTADGIYIHAIDAETGQSIWTNDSLGRLWMPQPHPPAQAASGVPPQGYLVASGERLLVPTGRAVPAALKLVDGELDYYQLQKNHSIGGSRVVAVDQYFANAGCLFDEQTGLLAARCGRGVLAPFDDGLLQSTGDRLLGFRWAQMGGHDRKGKPIVYRGLKPFCDISLGESPMADDPSQVEKAADEVALLGTLYRPQPRFKEAVDSIPKETTLERSLSQIRPDVEAAGLSITPFLATPYEKLSEVIVAGKEAVCATPGRLSIVDLESGKVRWTGTVDGAAIGLAVSDGCLVAGTVDGSIYCFGEGTDDSSAASETAQAKPAEPDVPKDGIDYAAAAAEILRATNVRDGYCFDIGCGDGRLAIELARQSNLYVYAAESDPARVAAARTAVDQAGLYGTRVAVHLADLSQLPYPRWCANLIVSSRAIFQSAVPPQSELQRIQRPCGGVICTGTPGNFRTEVRGPLEGAGNWTHQNADAANTLCSIDAIHGPLEVSWFGDVDFEIPDRHGQGPAPQFLSGVLVSGGVDGLCAVDAYNGRKMWTYPLPGLLKDYDGVHHDVGVGDTGSPFCLAGDSVYVKRHDRCLRIELATGRRLAEFATPAAPDGKNRAWGYIACVDGTLLGTVANEAHTVSPRYAGIELRTESVLLFGLDPETGRVKWRYEPRHSIRNNAIAIGSGRVYLIDRPLAMEDRLTELPSNNKHRPLLKPGDQPGGVLLALDLQSGRELWRQDENIWGTQLGTSPQRDVLLMHYQGVRHNFFKLPSEVGGRMAAFRASTGELLWDREAEYVTRPILNGPTIYTERAAWKLETGDPIEFDVKRTFGCGQIAGSRNLLLLRSATLGYFDLSRDVGMENFGGIRPGCWFNAIAAGRLVLVPDGSSKCACSYQMQAWVALQEQVN